MNSPLVELAPLIGAEHLRLALTQRLLQGLDTEVCLQRVGQSPSYHVPAVPVHDCHQVEEAPGHGQVGVNGAEKLGHWGAGIVYHLPDDRGP